MQFKCLKNYLSSLTLSLSLSLHTNFPSSAASGGHCDSCNYDMLQRQYLEEKNISL